MKKLLLIAMLAVLSCLSFAKEGGEGDDFFSLYNEASKAVNSPEMQKEVGMTDDEKDMIKDIINNGWYKIKMLEAEKLKQVFEIDRILIDGENGKTKEKVDKHFAEIKKINEKASKIYYDTKAELHKYIDTEKLMKK